MELVSYASHLHIRGLSAPQKEEIEGRGVAATAVKGVCGGEKGGGGNQARGMLQVLGMLACAPCKATSSMYSM